MSDSPRKVWDEGRDDYVLDTQAVMDRHEFARSLRQHVPEPCVGCGADLAGKPWPTRSVCIGCGQAVCWGCNYPNHTHRRVP